MVLLWLKVCRKRDLLLCKKVTTVVIKGGAVSRKVMSRESGVTQGYFDTAIFLPKIADVCCALLLVAVFR